MKDQHDLYHADPEKAVWQFPGPCCNCLLRHECKASVPHWSLQFGRTALMLNFESLVACATAEQHP